MPLFTISYLSDFEMKVSNSFQEMLKESILMYLNEYSIKNLSYLLVSVMSSPNLSNDDQLIQTIKQRISQINHADSDIDNGTRERLAITMGPEWSMDFSPLSGSGSHALD